ncbi:MAG: hypothetical protein ACRDRW_16530 [Pseudonocardiaceae bacterium]
MTTDDSDLVIAKRLLDAVKAQGFQFRRVGGPDGALLGTRRIGEWTELVYLDGFSRNCYALRERKTSLVAPNNAWAESRVDGGALNVLNTVLTWGES